MSWFCSLKTTVTPFASAAICSRLFAVPYIASFSADWFSFSCFSRFWYSSVPMVVSPSCSFSRLMFCRRSFTLTTAWPVSIFMMVTESSAIVG